jgi:hypothetical protein
VAVLALMTMACSSARPVLYPNEHFKSVGQSVADADIAECENMAKAAGADRQTGEAGALAKGTAVGAGVGAAGGAIGGAISGGQGSAPPSAPRAALRLGCWRRSSGAALGRPRHTPTLSTDV